MKLPDFLEFEPFNALRQKMQAEQLGKFELFDHRLHLTGWERELLVTSGVNASARDLRILQDNTLAFKNSRVALLNPAEATVFHIANCERVKTLRTSSTQEESKVTTDIAVINQKNECQVCTECLQVLSYKGFDQSRNRRQVYSEEIRSAFSLNEYFKKYPAYPLESKPNNFHF